MIGYTTGKNINIKNKYIFLANRDINNYKNYAQPSSPAESGNLNVSSFCGGRCAIVCANIGILYIIFKHCCIKTNQTNLDI